MAAAAGVLFDLVGTLAELREPVGACYARAAARQGIELPAWRVSDAFERVVRRAEAMVFPHLAPAERVEAEREWWRRIVRSTFLAADSTILFPEPGALFDELWAHYSDTRAWQLRDGARELIETTRGLGLRRGLASNFDHRLPDLIEDLGIAQLFDSITIPSQVGSQKPEASFFLAACGRLGCAPDATIFVGDDPKRDLAAAAHAGMRVVDAGPTSDLRRVAAEIEALATLVAH